MASAPPSPLASSEEKTNGWKLSRLLIDGGTTVLRDLFDQIHPPRTLRKSLDSHKTTLEELLNEGVLYTSQWETLFPRSGAPPVDSRNFDNSLLFLLLTTICGLSRPRSGWHQKPQKKDRSREANLARIKFYRNKIYGHVTTTGIDATTFTDLWKEISAALRSLGLQPTDIDRLKEERCGVEDYIALLFKWKESEENIKSQLQRIDHAQTNLQKSVDGVRQTQL
ncbi:E3 ubiquitin-protein ligase DZIP3-like [Stylophora pistillata]|uniref:E3 ubiquitin-protein ligase DZIP3-like n=1 Tax=Stylophora pistillata TaxID=50429 RepID=UPI000C0544A4|nr:E3 ubiquitin-protein ligase DZIP3-like [Stylophora pistillata]